MKRALIKLGFVAFVLILLIPSRIGIAFVTDFYRTHPFVTGLLIVLLLSGIGYWLRSQSEMKLNRPKEYS
jgi:hypothetical protein